MQAAKRKLDKEMEALQDNIDALTSENNKVVKSKKKVQEEVSRAGFCLMPSVGKMALVGCSCVFHADFVLCLSYEFFCNITIYPHY